MINYAVAVNARDLSLGLRRDLFGLPKLRNTFFKKLSCC
jgi:hypothetical protein